MKAQIRIAIMLMSMIIGTLAASAQSAERGTPHRTQQRKSTPALSSRSQKGEAVKSKKQTGQHVSSRSNKNKDYRSNNSGKSPDRQVATRSSSTRQQPDRQVNTRKNTQNTKAYRNNTNRNTDQSANNRNKNLVKNSRKVSTTTRYNSRSDYRSPNRTVNAGKTHLDPKPRANQVNRNPHVVVNRNYNSHSHAHKQYYYPSKRVKMHVHPRTYHNHYKVMYYPAHREIIWTKRMHRYYMDLYPGFIWNYHFGYHIQTISAFETRYNVGEVARIYGRVYATWYNRESDDLLLFFGGEFPHQEFTMVVPGHIARRFNWRPERYFLGQHILATGLITSYEGNPEMIIKKKRQLDVY